MYLGTKGLYRGLMEGMYADWNRGHTRGAKVCGEFSVFMSQTGMAKLTKLGTFWHGLGLNLSYFHMARGIVS